MAKQQTKKPRKAAKRTPSKKKSSRTRRVWKWTVRVAFTIALLIVIWIALLSTVQPPRTFFMASEAARIGSDVKQAWVSIDDVADVMPRSVVAAEDANFCLHWGFDMAALREAIEDGGNRGASTLSQQVTKNVFLWHGRSYVRKALEAVLTPVVELFWSKRRIVEVYLNVAEFDEGVFGVEAAAKHYFGVSAAKLSATQAARLAAILPNPKERSASKPGAFTRRRAENIVDGAATIQADGRADCFAD